MTNDKKTLQFKQNTIIVNKGATVTQNKSTSKVKTCRVLPPNGGVK